MAARVNELRIRPQPGPQETFLSTTADIAIYGGSAGGGKTWALLLEPLRHVEVPGFFSVTFRREAVNITNEGGLWDEALKLYPLLGAKPNQQPRHTFRFPDTGVRFTFAHLNMERDVLGWHGAQIPLIQWDELTEFTKFQFFYMLSRNRSTCGVRPYMRATCNPDPDSWVAEFISWWIDQDTGYPIPERSGVVRWFIRLGDTIVWGDSPEELAARHGVASSDALSVTFIRAHITDNQILLDKDPAYMAKLRAMPLVQRERLLGGNWKIRPAAGLYFKREDVTIIEERPPDVDMLRWVRAWDLAATEKTEDNDPDWSVGVLIGYRRSTRRIVFADVVRVRQKATDVRKLIRTTAEIDGKQVTIRMQQDPGQAGKDQAQSYIDTLIGYAAFFRRPTGDKVTRAEPLAAQWQAQAGREKGNVEVVRAPWNDAFFAEFEAFPEAKHDDQVDAAADGFAALPTSPDTDIAVGAPLETAAIPEDY